jgi:methyl-accepting chemotaxis protein
MRRLSVKMKNILFSCITTALVGIVIAGVSYYMNMSLVLNQLASESEATVEAWYKDVEQADVEKLMQNNDRDSKVGKSLEEHFNNLSQYQPQVAQGYIFGTELDNGTDTSVVSGPTVLLDALEEGNLAIGDLYTQPDNIVKVIEEMKETKKTVASKPYTDDFGTWVTVVKPYIDSNGEVYAYYGVDFNAKPYIDGQHKFMYIIISILVIVLLLVSYLQYLSVTKTFRPIQDLVRGIEEATNGNFDVTLHETKDELGLVVAKFNTMTKNISGLLSSIKGASAETSDNSRYLAESVRNTSDNMHQLVEEVINMSERFETQTKSTTEVLRSIEELSAVVETVASNTSNVSELAMDMENIALKGNNSLSLVQEQMALINGSTKSSEQHISTLKQRSEEISGIVELITSIADQTNLLALNAAIEAARAGEHGKGFAVVAEEVRKLAEQSKTSAEQIHGLITHIQKETDEAFVSINNGSTYVNEGVKVVEETEKVFSDILAATQEVTSKIQEVSSASEEMAAENHEITVTFEQLSDLSNQNYETTEKITNNINSQQKSIESIVAITNDMSNVVDNLDKVVSVLKSQN